MDDPVLIERSTMQAIADAIRTREAQGGIVPSSGGMDAIPIGTIITMIGSATPTGYLACDGALYNIDDYDLLANHIAANFGSVNFFGGDGVTTFAVPDFTDAEHLSNTEYYIAYLDSEKDGTIYGFHINSSESDPDEAITYMEDAIGMIPVRMNYDTGAFNWGTWRNAFFMPRPCMLKYDGTVDYYLDENDYTKKEDGETASDVANSNYGGNAMMEWGRDGKKIWYKIVPDDGDPTSASVYIADYKADDDYHAWSFINNQGVMVDHFYTPIYDGCLDDSGRLRSISGMSLMKNKTAEQEIAAAELNNPGTDKLWYTEVYADVVLINLLLTLVGKTLDSQTCFGNGVTSGGESGIRGPGTLNDKGLFFGYSDTTSAVKVFGMENWYGNRWRRFAGNIDDKGTYKYKLTYGTQDGSEANGYNLDGSGYLIGPAVPVASQVSVSYIKQQKYNTDGSVLPVIVGGASNTYYCDGMWSNNDQIDYALRGGRSDAVLPSGTWTWNMNNLVSRNGWDVSTAPSCKPLS